ncbi:hypothetical protein HMPREF3069_05200 [Achromobacter xylosoxidans]|uniref:hypothetical protein n=1 Tax=Achromobacter TaxID=222 RepID=UPI0008A56602|nr:hypothetical protein [Achromobacter xylosoxidans]OFS61687.1 hypothetical protein HMPREF3069_05200 [Achromobacter xylosoxidans]
MAKEQESGNKSEPKLILRGVQRREGSDGYETTVLLFEGKGDFLQGYVVSGGQKRDVIAHMNERKPDPETGEIKPGFLKLSERVGKGEEQSWREVGYGNAMNVRKDGKPVFYDTVLFNVGGETLNARVTQHVTPELHEKLGFTSPRAERPRTEKAAKAEQAEEPAPEQQPAARRSSRPAARKAA